MQTAVESNEAAAASHPFVKEMVRQLRAIDNYGTYDTWTDEKVLAPLILTKSRKAEIPLVGDPDEETVSRVKAFYNAAAVSIEAKSALLTVSLVHLSHEGFGRVLLSTGRLILVDRSLRDVHRFGFASLEKLAEQGEKAITGALTILEKFPEAAEA